MDIFLIFAQNIDCGYTLEPPRRGGSNEYPQCMFWIQNKKKQVDPCYSLFFYIKVGYDEIQVGKDQEKGAIRKRFPLQIPRWEKKQLTIRYLYHETYRKPNEQLFSQYVATQLPELN